MTLFSGEPWHSNQADAARAAGCRPRAEANNRQPRMGLSHRAGGAATVPGFKLVRRGPMYERAYAIPPALMIPCEGTNCVRAPGTAGEGGAEEEGTVGALACAEQPHSGSALLKGQITIN